MSAIKEEKHQETLSSEDNTVQMDLPIASEVTDTRNVIQLPKVPTAYPVTEGPEEIVTENIASAAVTQYSNVAELDSLREIEKKKEAVLGDVEKLNQYLQEKQKKFQEAKTFIEQYERVVTNKQRYIAEVEGERNAILLEVEAFKKAREKIKREVDEYQHELEIYKKQIAEARFDAASWDTKSHEMLLQHNTVQKSLKEISQQKAELIKQREELEQDIEKQFHELQSKHHELENIKRELMDVKNQCKERSDEVQKLGDLREGFLQSYTKLESDFEKNLSRLKSDEATWRQILEMHYQEIEEAKEKSKAAAESLEEKQREIEVLKIDIGECSEKLLRLGEMTQIEKMDAEQYQEKANIQLKKVEELKSRYIELEQACIREQSEVDYLKSKKKSLEQECEALHGQGVLANDALCEVIKKKQYLLAELSEIRTEKLSNLEAEIQLRKQEAMTFRSMAENEFRTDLAKEKEKMATRFWSELTSRLESLSEEVSSYMTSCFNVSLSAEQQEKLRLHISSLAKYYQSLDAKKATFKDLSFFLKYNQHYIVLALLCTGIALLAVNFIK